VGIVDGRLTLSQTYQPGTVRGWQFLDRRWDGAPLPERSILIVPGIVRGGRPDFSQYVTISLAYPVALFAGLPSIQVWRVVRSRRRTANRSPMRG